MMARNRHGALQVPIDIWHHTATDKVITLVGVIHIADQCFWDDTQEIIGALQEQGHEIHFEGVLRDAPEDEKLFPDYRRFAKLMGLTDQGTGLLYDHAWKRTDVGMRFLIAAAHPGRLNRLRAMDWEAGFKAADDIPWAGRALHWALRHSHLIPRGRYASAFPREVLVGYRNRVAASHALATQADVVALWGADHLPGIGQLLWDAGYHRDHRIWRTAIARPAGRHA